MLMQFIFVSPAAFIHALARVGALIFSAPIFGSRHLPLRLKIALAIFFALVMAPLMQGAAQPSSVAAFFVSIVIEAMTGLIIGFAVRLIFVGIDFAGRLCAVESSFGIGTVYDSSMRMDSRGVPEFFTIFSILVFLSVNGHLMAVEALSRSFQLIPAAGLSLTPRFMEDAVIMSKDVFVVALKLSAPVIAASLFVNAACGLAARSMPALDARNVSFAAAVVAGIFVIFISLPSLEAVLMSVFDRGFEGLYMLLRGMRLGV